MPREITVELELCADHLATWEIYHATKSVEVRKDGHKLGGLVAKVETVLSLRCSTCVSLESRPLLH